MLECTQTVSKVPSLHSKVKVIFKSINITPNLPKHSEVPHIYSCNFRAKISRWRDDLAESGKTQLTKEAISLLL